MGRNMLICVSDDKETIESARAFAQAKGVQFQNYSTSEWKYSLEDPNFRQKVTGEMPSLSVGVNAVDQGAKILPFPGGVTVPEQHHSTVDKVDNQKVRTINELESIAIENAIHEFNGNLTEAAKALGIGRATLYRKVKQYSIDPSSARRKRAA